MVEGAGELKLDMGFYEERWLVSGTVGAQPNNARHTEKGNEKAYRKKGWDWKMGMAYLTLPW